MPEQPTQPTSRTLAKDVVLTGDSGAPLAGDVEHFEEAGSLVITDESGRATLLTVPTRDAVTITASLADDEVLLAAWTPLRGIPAALAAAGVVELTGAEHPIGPFRLEALVARVL